MSRFRSTSVRRWAAWLAVVGLLFQAGLSAWHAAAMFGFVAGQSDGQAQAAMMCHKAAFGTLDERDGSQPAAKNCSCCLGLISLAASLAAASDVRHVLAAEVKILARSHDVTAGRHPLAPEIRGPPHLV